MVPDQLLSEFIMTKIWYDFLFVFVKTPSTPLTTFRNARWEIHSVYTQLFGKRFFSFCMG